jgi:hypothetical protein
MDLDGSPGGIGSCSHGTSFFETPIPRPSSEVTWANYTTVNWLGTDHTSDYVEPAVMEPVSEALGPFPRNTDLFDLMVEAAGVRAHAEQ